MCSVYFSNAGLVDAPSAEAVGRTGDVPVSVVANHAWLLLMLLWSASASTVPRRPTDSPFVGMLIAHFWRYF